MSFGGLSDGRSGGALAYGNAAMTAGELSPPQLISQRLPNSAFISPRLSLGLVNETEPRTMFPSLRFIHDAFSFLAFWASNRTWMDR